MTEKESYRFCKIMYFTVPNIQCCENLHFYLLAQVS